MDKLTSREYETMVYRFKKLAEIAKLRNTTVDQLLVEDFSLGCPTNDCNRCIAMFPPDIGLVTDKSPDKCPCKRQLPLDYLQKGLDAITEHETVNNLPSAITVEEANDVRKETI